MVTDYLKKAGVLGDLEKLGFYVVGYGCTTCIGNSGPLPDEVSKGIAENDLVVASVLSGNRNFEGRVHAEVKMNYLASPPLVVAYAHRRHRRHRPDPGPARHTAATATPVYLRDIWPSNKEIGDTIAATVGPEMFAQNYADVFKGDSRWNQIASPEGESFEWDEASTYIKNPPYFDGMTMDGRHDRRHPRRARAGPVRRLDHHRPHLAGRQHQEGLAGGPLPAGARRAAGRLQQLRLAPRQRRRDGARHLRQHPHQEPDARWRGRRQHAVLRPARQRGEKLAIYDAAMKYKADGVPLVVFAGKEYGTGSSRDWAAKGTNLLGVKAVVAESFERIHRSNLVGMGVLPLQFHAGENAQSLGLDGSETIDDHRPATTAPRRSPTVVARKAGRQREAFEVKVLLLTPKEVEYFRHGGILHYVLRQLASKKAA